MTRALFVLLLTAATPVASKQKTPKQGPAGRVEANARLLGAGAPSVRLLARDVERDGRGQAGRNQPHRVGDEGLRRSWSTGRRPAAATAPA